jgi:hypothetical protein
MAERKRNWLGISLLVLDLVAWAVFGYFLVKTITAGTSVTNCFSADCAGQGAEEAASYVPWVIGAAFAAAMLLTVAILAFRLRRSTEGPKSWDEVARMSSQTSTAPAGWTSGASIPGYGPAVTQVAPGEFALPGAGPTWSAAPAGGAPASVVATRTLGSTPSGMQMEVDLDVAVPGQAPRRVTKQLTVPPGGLARLYPGATVPVTVNPADPSDVTVHLGA